MSGRLPIWEIPLSENSRTQMTERHSDLTVTLEWASFPKMTLTPRDVKGKGWSKDWCICYLPESDDTSPEALGNLKCPFNTIPELKDSIPAEFTENVWHLLSSQDTRAPYIGYYARLNNALVSVSNVYGIWFEVHVWENKFECFQLAQNELRLKNHPLLGINFILLEQTGVPTWPPSCAEGLSEPRDPMPFAEAITATTKAVQEEQVRRPLTPFEDPSSDKDDKEDKPRYKDVFGSFGMHSSQTACNKPPCQPCGTGDDPFTLESLLQDDKEDKAHQLEGIHPDKFNGDHSQTTRFLAAFNRFMLMNYKADIAKDPVMHSIYFLLLLEGPKCEGWVDAADRWLHHVVEDPSMIPHRSNAWKELKKQFKEAFSDYTECKRAQDELKKLKMKNDNLDEYLATFETHALRADIDMNDHTNLQTFALRLPRSLADACIKMENPETYKQWRATVQCQQKIYLKMKLLHSEYGTFNTSCTQEQGQRQNSGWVWRRPGGNNPGFNNQNWHGPGNHAPPWPCLPPQDDNAMDMSAVICKATSDKEHEEYWKTGRCFECRKQGHLVCDCPNKKTRACTTCTVQIEDDNKLVVSKTPSTSMSLAARVAHLSEEDRCAFMDEMRSFGEDMDFQAAWVLQLLLRQFSIILVLCT